MNTKGEDRQISVISPAWLSLRVISPLGITSMIQAVLASFSQTGDIGYLSKVIKSSGIQFRYTPANYHYSWHGAPQRQFIVNLDADVEVEVSSGEKRVLKQGEVFFVEDLTG